MGPSTSAGQGDSDIAIVGMAARLPGASDIAQYWRNLRDGVSSIRRLSKEELSEAGVDPSLMRHRDYVPFAAPLDGFKGFDAEFFGLSPKDAAIMDPQHRQFLETAWEAFENAGHVPDNFDGQIGVFAGCGMGSYFYFNLCSNPDLVQNTGMFLLRHTGNDKDFMTTRLAHVFDLRGPAVNLQTACSTSLVATHYAVQALLNGECDMALAGGVTIELPAGRGYLYKENEILSPDGACHAFDHRAQGTVFGSGAGVVVLRRLEDALADGDHIWSVIKGSAINNDGAQKAGYLAPSVDGQAAAVAEAQAVAGVTADTVDYVECHGTGTYLGDPIEVAALTNAFRESSDRTAHCRIGSVKTNIGHLDTAAGVASLIKASLALHHRQMPPSLGFEKPNPAIDFDGSPFRVNDRLTDWPRAAHPRRAGVNSLGVGGTNAHVLLEEAPRHTPGADSDWPFQILTVSGRNKAALEANAQRLAQHLRTHTDQPLADVAFTLQQGRRGFEQRRVVVAETHEEAARLLAKPDPRRTHTHSVLPSPETVFMFPGGGAQYAGMARDLYETEPVFADWMDKGLGHLATLTDRDIKALWLPQAGAQGDLAQADAALKQPGLQLPLIMICEYALAQLWISWGITPSALTGHSMGENTAACLAGVMSFEDCIGLVHLRGTLFDEVPAGGMLSVPLSADALRPYLGDDLDLAAVNAAEMTVATGPVKALDALQDRLLADDITPQRIAIDIAAHSRMLEPIFDRFRAYLRSIPLQPPQIPLTSNVTGAVLSDAQATDPDYWVTHLRSTVLFAQNIDALAAPNRVFLEVGPGKALSALARQHPKLTGNQILSSLRHPDERIADDKYMLELLGRLAALGLPVDWSQIWGAQPRQRLPLPTYAFQHSDYFIEPGVAQAAEPALLREDDISAWGWQPVWRPRAAELALDLPEALIEMPLTWLVFADDTGVADRCCKRLTEAGSRVITIRPGDSFARVGENGYVIAPERGRESYERLIADLSARNIMVDRIAHFWLLTGDRAHRPGSSFFHRLQEHGFYALLFLAQTMAEEPWAQDLQINVLTNGAQRVRDEPLTFPAKATVHGPVGVIPQELPGVEVASLDIVLPDLPPQKVWGNAKAKDAYQRAMDRLTTHVLEDLMAEPGSRIAALRGDRRYELATRQTKLPDAAPIVTQDDTILITGGFGGIGQSLAADFAKRGARLVLVSRRALPERSDWPQHVLRHAPNDPISQRIQAIEALEATGADVMIGVADVCDRAALETLRAEAEARFGRITGVIHAAGVLADAPLAIKTPSSIEDVFTPKIHGTDVLGQVFPDGAVDWMVLFSSSSIVTTPAGQVDYVAANAYIDAFAQAQAGGKTRVIALGWGTWTQVGMAAQVLAERSGDLPKAANQPVDLPLLDSMSFDAKGNRVFDMSLSTRHWVLNEHRTKDGHALLPGTGYLTLASHALTAHGETGPFEIRDLDFLRPLRVADEGARHAQLRLRRTARGYDMDVLADATLHGRKGRVCKAQGALHLLPMAQPETVPLGNIWARCGSAASVAGGKLTTAQAVLLRFGPRWNVLDRRAFGADEAIAELSLPPEAAEDGCILHPALLDIATGFAMDLIDGWQPSHLWAPVRYGRVRVHAPLPDKIVSWVRNAAVNTARGETARFDITLCAPDGTVLVEISDFTLRKLASPASLSMAAPLTPAEIEFEDSSTDQPLSPAEQHLARLLENGIRPNEGVEAFHRALASAARQVIVSPLDLHALKASATAPANTGQPQSFERPQLRVDFAAPEGEIETTLAAFWQDLLGVTQAGAEDSFFDLGGHSLIAVRLFAKIKRTFRVEFPISVLFEAPTIRACAALIAQTYQPISDTTDSPRAPERRFKHLVAMHDGDGGAKRPFFLVAGMFGNVLNLRHLANLLGADRPFYGLQARGLLGGEPPHETIEEAARDYIAEMRRVQPNGPYLVGGFSGGGITACEIARQLETAGESVSAVVLLDTPLPRRRALSRRDRLLIQWQEARAKGVLYPFVWARNRLKWELSKRAPSEHTETQGAFHNAEIEAAFYRATAAYQLTPWYGRLVLYRPPLRGKWQVSNGAMVNSERSYVTHDNDWGTVMPQVEVVEVPGNHDSMVLEPNVRVLAARLKALITQTDQGEGDVIRFPGQAAE